MSESLRRFTPNAPGLERDAILYAAGRRSARGSWLWKALAGLFAVTQVITLLALWPRPQPVETFVGPPSTVAPVDPVPTPVSPPADVWTAGSRSEELPERPALSTIEFVPSDPPLTVRSGFRFD